MKPPIKDTLKRGQQRTIIKPKLLVYTHFIDKSPLKEDNLSTKDITAGPEGDLY